MIEVLILTRVKAILGVQDKDALLQVLIQNQTEALLAVIGEEVLPESLMYIVVETTIARYNRLGSEGLKSEGIDVISQSFIENLLEPYQTQISGYLSAKNKTTSRLRML